MDDRKEVYSTPKDISEEELDGYIEDLESTVNLYREWRRHGWVVDKVNFLVRLEEVLRDSQNLEVTNRKVVRLHQ